ncbi:type VI secretion system protein TssA [Maridesulfovibrio frigidus]|uniref:type VI secretion system protein TssA n=1 Tax=Maridesulfovibrio frigidus TaxID=340956 RepID=UPI0004E1B641|nr:type VI secretion system protein TssA [Maridesulfovibrio frigidus]
MDLITLGKEPISVAKPAGDDARYEPEYDELQQQVDKLTSVTADGVIDWKQVVKLCSAILSSKSKDIKVASYLGVALLNLKGVEGLSVSAQILLDMVTEYWDNMYPAKKRMRGRFNAISWWSDNAEKFLTTYEGGDIPQDTVDLLAQRITGLDEALAEKADDAPILRSLADYANRLPVEATEDPESEQPQDSGAEQSESESKQQVKAQSVSAATTTQSARSDGISAGSINSPEECQRQLSAGLDLLSAVADYQLANDVANVAGYRLRRMAAWLPVVALPPAEKGLTMIPSPDSSVKDSIISLLNSRDYIGAAQAAESRVGQFLFWLDLSHLTVLALEGLGEDYSNSKLAVELEVSVLVKRLAGIESMTFSDGTPFADTKTKSWLKSLNREKDAGFGGTAEKGAAAEKIFAEAAKLVKSKKIFDAVSIIQDSLNSSPSGHERFLLRLGLIRLLTDVDQSGLAHAHADEVIEHIKKFRLDKWDPELALRGLMTVYEALIAEGGDEAALLAKDTLKQICRINPAEALKIDGLN